MLLDSLVIILRGVGAALVLAALVVFLGLVARSFWLRSVRWRLVYLMGLWYDR